ncbi:MAG: NAD(P)H-dependent oxidoreductase [Rhodobacteraceae bacterium]|nr:NAD(P)H-dependent oxidoreductase [Paracoccaceae bacterium]
MSNILLVTSSLMAEKSLSNRIAGDVVAKVRAQHPAAKVTERHLTAENTPHISSATLAALSAPSDQRTPEQSAIVALADGIIAEAELADVIVIAAPMYNFSIPSTLKSWIDYLARAGRTFRYTEQGPVGLLTGKKVYVVESRGGVHAGQPTDHQEPYLRTVLGFVGLTDVTFIRAEGQAMGAEPAANGISTAHARVAQLFGERVAA